MDAVIRSLSVYLFLFLVLRASGKRTLAQVTTFDLVLLLIISEATQQALLGEDFSLTQAFVVIVSLIGVDIFISLVEQRWPRLQPYVESLPVVIFEDGKPIEKRMRKARVSIDDIMEQGRHVHGLERLEQIKYAVLERNGAISVIPREVPWTVPR